MKCPYCGAEESKVIDSRPTEDSERIRRRRECLSCHMPVSYTHLDRYGRTGRETVSVNFANTIFHFRRRTL